MMQQLEAIVKTFSGMDEAAFDLSRGMWQEKTYQKGDFYNEYRSVCKYLGVVLDGVFRTYYVDEKTGGEKNLFFYSPNQVVVSYASFLTQSPCKYYTQAVTDARIWYIHIDQL